MILNRVSEKLVFSSPSYISFYLRITSSHCGGGIVVFNYSAVDEMQLNIGDLIEFEIEDLKWFVLKSENKNAYKLKHFGKKSSKALYFNSNRLVRGFLERHDRPVGKWVKCILIKNNKFSWKININNKLKN